MKLKTLLKNAISLLLTLIIVSSILDFIRKPNIPPEINATALYDLQGNAFFLPQLDQAKPTIIYFWGSWCGPCRASHPHLKELHKKYSGKVVFVNVADENVKDLEQAKKLWKQAVKEDGMTWTQILNNEGKEEQDLLKLYNITSFPTKILIDPEGKVVARLVGATADPEEFLKAL